MVALSVGNHEREWACKKVIDQPTIRRESYAAQNDGIVVLD